jgi:hypothetical protein
MISPLPWLTDRSSVPLKRGSWFFCHDHGLDLLSPVHRLGLSGDGETCSGSAEGNANVISEIYDLRFMIYDFTGSAAVHIINHPS